MFEKICALFLQISALKNYAKEKEKEKKLTSPVVVERLTNDSSDDADEDSKPFRQSSLKPKNESRFKEYVLIVYMYYGMYYSSPLITFLKFKEAPNTTVFISVFVFVLFRLIFGCMHSG